MNRYFTERNKYGPDTQIHIQTISEKMPIIYNKVTLCIHYMGKK